MSSQKNQLCKIPFRPHPSQKIESTLLRHLNITDYYLYIMLPYDVLRFLRTVRPINSHDSDALPVDGFHHALHCILLIIHYQKTVHNPSLLKTKNTF